MSREERAAVGLAALLLVLVAVDVLGCARAWWASPLCLPWHGCR